MGIFTKKRDEFSGPSSPAAKRAAMLATPDLVPWAETCLYEIGRSLSDFRKDPEDLHLLAQANEAVAVLGTIMDEILDRSGERVAASPSSRP